MESAGRTDFPISYTKTTESILRLPEPKHTHKTRRVLYNSETKGTSAEEAPREVSFRLITANIVGLIQTYNTVCIYKSYQHNITINQNGVIA